MKSGKKHLLSARALPLIACILLAACAPQGGGHDIAAACGEDDKMWIGGAGILLFDRSDGVFSEAPGGVSVGNVKCIGNLDDGRIIRTVAANVYAAHDTDRFVLFDRRGNILSEAVFGDGDVKKLDVFNTPSVRPAILIFGRQAVKMNIQGYNKVTLLDFPGRVACTVFTGGCDLRCPFCHNSQLVLHPNYSPTDEDEIFDLLRRRRGLIDGVALTGGEPLLQPDVERFLSRVKDMGYAVKLDTNGTHPERMSRVIEAGLVDYAAMDIKNSPEKYPDTVGIPAFDVSPVRESAAYLLEGRVDYEFRTTVVAELHDEESFRGIGGLIGGARRYFLQGFADSGALIRPGLHAASREDMEKYVRIASGYAERAEIRGV